MHGCCSRRHEKQCTTLVHWLLLYRARSTSYSLATNEFLLSSPAGWLGFLASRLKAKPEVLNDTGS